MINFSLDVTNNTYSEWWLTLASQLKESETQQNCLIIHETSYGPITTVLLKKVDNLIDEFDIIIKTLKNLVLFDFVPLTDLLFSRFIFAAQILSSLYTDFCIPYFLILLKSSLKFFRSVFVILKLFFSLKQTPSQNLCELSNFIGGFRVTVHNHFLKVDKDKKANQIKPLLVFEMEKIESLLVKYSKLFDDQYELLRDWKRFNLVYFFLLFFYLFFPPIYFFSKKIKSRQQYIGLRFENVKQKKGKQNQNNDENEEVEEQDQDEGENGEDKQSKKRKTTKNAKTDKKKRKK